MKKLLLTGTALVAFAAVSAQAADAPANNGLSLDGLTLYGNIDVGMSYQTHGAPLSDTWYPGAEYLINKNSNKSQFNIGPSGLSQSFIGLKGFEEFADGWAAVFKVETNIDVWSGTVSDAQKTLVKQNGLSAASGLQTNNGDGSRNGDAFAVANAGISSKLYGDLTLGRHKTVNDEAVGAYDPQGGAFAFTPLAYSGFTKGFGDTEETIWLNSIRYSIGKIGDLPIHFAAIYKQQNYGGATGPSAEVRLGGDYAGFSLDGTYGHIRDAINAGSLNAAQAIAAPGTLTATVSDNTGFTLLGKYKIGALSLMSGAERIIQINPQHVLPVGTTGAGGYVYSVISNVSSTGRAKVTDVYWAGGRYQVTPKLEIGAGYYHYEQHSFAKVDCSNISSSTCSGQLNAFSISAEYKFTKRFEMYGGAMYSSVGNGLANGYAFSTSTIAPTVGARFTF
jgi:predicted porin